MPVTLFVCTHRRLGFNPSCAAGGGEALFTALAEIAASRGLAVEILSSGCLGHCAEGPNIKKSAGPFIHRCRAEEASDILDRVLDDDKAIDPCLARAGDAR